MKNYKKISDEAKTKILWNLFFLVLLITAIDILSDFFRAAILQKSLLESLLLSLPVLLLFFHAAWTLSFFRGILFILLAFLTGFIFEFIGLKYGVVFGGNYVYALEGLKIFTVPLNVPLYWAVFIYTGFCITNSFLYWLNKDKPTKNKKDGLLLPLLILFDGLIVVAIDLFMDPLQVKAGSWTWLEGGPYFGIPIGNFIGWFLVTIIVTGLFRVGEYFKPLAVKKELKSVFIIPVLGYGLLYLSFLASAIKIKMLNLALIGSLTMLPVVTSNFFLLTKSIRKNKNI